MEDQILTLVPPKYLGLAVVVLGALRVLDGAIRLIPDKWLSAHTTTEAIVLGLRKGFGWIFKKKEKEPAPDQEQG